MGPRPPEAQVGSEEKAGEAWDWASGVSPGQGDGCDAGHARAAALGPPGAVTVVILSGSKREGS